VLFSTLPFAVFFAVVLVGYHALPASWSARKAWLLAASWVFYATWAPAFLGVLVLTTAIDFLLALRIHEAITADARHAARRLVILSLVLNLGVLAFFKYAGFLYFDV
jgi:alginate O-acetyltransferase complex protein AlgI